MTINDILTFVFGLLMTAILTYVAIRTRNTGIIDDSD